LLLAATVRSFAHLPLGISDRNTLRQSEGAKMTEDSAFFKKYVAVSLASQGQRLALAPL